MDKFMSAVEFPNNASPWNAYDDDHGDVGAPRSYTRILKRFFMSSSPLTPELWMAVLRVP